VSRGGEALSYWLLKTEPSEYSYFDLERDGWTVWEGVTNNLALQHLRSVRKGDRALLYHTGKEKAAVGIVQIISDPYPDPSLADPRRVVLKVQSMRRLARSVPLAEIKKHPKLKTFDLVCLPRLSVIPVSEETWADLMELSKVESTCRK
jgi:predicted RNA-binding protein with PUA-like domain